MVRSGQKWPKVVKNGQKLLKLAISKPKMSKKVLKYLLGLKGPMGLNVLNILNEFAGATFIFGRTQASSIHVLLLQKIKHLYLTYISIHKFVVSLYVVNDKNKKFSVDNLAYHQKDHKENSNNETFSCYRTTNPRPRPNHIHWLLPKYLRYPKIRPPKIHRNPMVHTPS